MRHIGEAKPAVAVAVDRRTPRKVGVANINAARHCGAGHSVGEITAAAAAGVLSAEQAMVFVRERGRAMAQAAALTPTGMSAVLGGDADEVVAAANALDLTAANINGAGQIVVAGTLEALAAFADAPPEKARVRPLQVTGAFHTDYMAPAVDVLARHSRSISSGHTWVGSSSSRT